MVLNKIFGKKDSKAGIDSLKERFSQVSQGGAQPGVSSPAGTPTQPAPQSTPSTQEYSPAPQVQVQDALGNALVSDPTPAAVPPQQAPPQLSPQPFGQQPIGFAPPSQQVPPAVPPQQAPSQGLDVSSIPPAQPLPAQASTIQPRQAPAMPAAQPTPGPSNPVTDLPSWAVESAGESIANEIGGSSTNEPQNQNKAAETLEQIEDKFYDAKLNSLIIDQVKELIEIDNNLNSRIDDLSSETKKEITEREKLAKKVDEHFAKVKELETNMEKFLGLYEMVTNQFNPFVDKGSSEMFLDDKDKKYDNPMIRDPEHPDVPVPQATAAANPIPAELRVEPTSVAPAQPVQSQVPPQQVPSMQASQSAQGAWKYCPIHHNIHPSLHFELANGQKLSSIYDVLAVVEGMDNETFSHHVNLKQNDLSNWIYKVLGLTDLGQQLDLIKTRPEMIQSIRSYIQEKMKDANQHQA